MASWVTCIMEIGLLPWQHRWYLDVARQRQKGAQHRPGAYGAAGGIELHEPGAGGGVGCLHR